MKEKIILKSANPEEYEDLVVECRVIENDKIGEYLETIPAERKFVGYKYAPVVVRDGIEGEVVETVLKTTIDGKDYILSEETTTVSYEVDDEGIKYMNKVITNVNSTSNEQYVTKASKVEKTYDLVGKSEEGNLVYTPSYDPREIAIVDENVIIMTAWGSKAVCLKGGGIVTYNASENDYNAIEAGALSSTYKKVSGETKKLQN